jgi:hypothetical protein
MMVTPGSSGVIVQITGRRFLPDSRLLLAAYPTSVGSQAVTLGMVRSSADGRFTFVTASRKLLIGEYTLRAWSLDFARIDLADTYFQVVV